MGSNFRIIAAVILRQRVTGGVVNRQEEEKMLTVRFNEQTLPRREKSVYGSVCVERIPVETRVGESRTSHRNSKTNNSLLAMTG